MGFKTSDLRPTQITPITPPAKSHLYKIFEIEDRAHTNELKVMLPAQASVIDFKVFAEDASAVTGTIDILLRRGSTIVASGTVDLTEMATQPSPVLYVTLAGLPNLVGSPETQDLSIYITTAGSLGGSLKVITEFVQ